MADEPERIAIGITGPLSGRGAMSIAFPGTVLALFVLAGAGPAMNALGGGQFARAAVPGLVAAVFAALLGRFLHDFVPQRAWLQGSLLVVRRCQRERRCDLATAEILRLGRTMPPLTRGYTDAVPVLRARQQPSGPVVRLVFRGDGLRILPAAQLLLLAEAIESGPPRSGQADKMSRRLRSLADRQKPPPALDWSFRTDPRGTRNAGE